MHKCDRSSNALLKWEWCAPDIIQADNNNNLVSRVVSDNVIIELVMSESVDTYIFLYTGLLH